MTLTQDLYTHLKGSHYKIDVRTTYTIFDDGTYEWSADE